MTSFFYFISSGGMFLHPLGGPFLASAYRIRRFVREHALADRPHTSLWLVKTYVIPAGMYGSQVWGTGFLQAGREFSSPLSTLASLAFSEGHVRCEAVYH